MSEVGHVACKSMFLDERNILAPTPRLYRNLIKSYREKWVSHNIPQSVVRAAVRDLGHG